MERLKWTLDEFKWVEANWNQLTGATLVDAAFRAETYRLYNLINGTTKAPTSCGRCWRNTKREVVQYFNKIKNII